MQLFDFIRILFENPNAYSELSNYDKAKQFFMTNRFMSIQYPIQANMLNHIRIPQAKAVDYWHRNMTNVYTKVPNWIFAKGQKKAAKEKETKVKLPGKPAIKAYLEAHRISSRELDEAFQMFGDSVYDPIRRLEQVMNQ